VPPNLSCARRARGRALLTAGRGRLTSAAMRSILRDHYDDGPHRPRAVDDPEFFSLCMHADPLDNTTAAMVVPLAPHPAPTSAAWLCLGSPCVGVFLPCWVEARLPAALGVAGAEPDAASPWWRMRELLSLVEMDLQERGPRVRAARDELESRLVAEAKAADAEATALRRAGRSAQVADVLSAVTARAVASLLEDTERLIRELGGRQLGTSS